MAVSLVEGGKSRYALEIAWKGGVRRVFMATAEAFDDEPRAASAMKPDE